MIISIGNMNIVFMIAGSYRCYWYFLMAVHLPRAYNGYRRIEYNNATNISDIIFTNQGGG